MTDVQFGTWEPEEKVNPYTDIVAKHIAAAEKNPNASYTLTVDVNDAQKEQFKYQKAANLAGKTAKLRMTDTSKVTEKPNADGEIERSGKVSLVFTITNRHKARRGKAAE